MPPSTRGIEKPNKPAAQHSWTLQDFESGHWIRSEMSLSPEYFMSEHEKPAREKYHSIKNLDQDLARFLHSVYTKESLNTNQMSKLNPEGLLVKLLEFQKAFPLRPRFDFNVHGYVDNLISKLNKLVEDINETNAPYPKETLWHVRDFGDLDLLRRTMAENNESELRDFYGPFYKTVDKLDEGLKALKQYQKAYNSIDNLDEDLAAIINFLKDKTFFSSEKLRKSVDVKDLLGKLTQFEKMSPKTLGGKDPFRVYLPLKTATYSLSKIIEEAPDSDFGKNLEKTSLE